MLQLRKLSYPLELGGRWEGKGSRVEQLVGCGGKGGERGRKEGRVERKGGEEGKEIFVIVERMKWKPEEKGKESLKMKEKSCDRRRLERVG